MYLSVRGRVCCTSMYLILSTTNMVLQHVYILAQPQKHDLVNPSCVPPNKAMLAIDTYDRVK